MFKGRGKSLEFIGVLGWKRRIYTLFTPLEDRIGNQDVGKTYVFLIEGKRRYVSAKKNNVSAENNSIFADNMIY